MTPGKHATVSGSVLALLFAFWMGCGPALRETYDFQIWRPSRRCIQGPIVLEAQADGNRWGESFLLTISATKYLHGYYAVELNGKIVHRGYIDTRRHQRIQQTGSASGATHQRINEETVSLSAPQNEFCVRRTRTSRGGPAATITTSTGGVRPNGAQTPTRNSQPRNGAATHPVSGRIQPPAIQGPPLVQTIDRKEMREILAHQASTGRFVQRIEYGQGRVAVYPCLDRRIQPPAKPRGTLRFIIWFDEPNDFRYALFQLQHRVWKPYPNERKYLAHLEEKRRQCSRSRRYRRSRHRAHNRHLLAHHRPTWCRLPTLHRNLPGRIEVSYQPWVRCDCLRQGPNHPCWGPGGRPGFEERALGFTWPCLQVIRDAGTNPPLRQTIGKGCWCFKKLRNEKCWGKGGYWAFRARLLARLRRDEARRIQARQKHAKQEERLAAGPPPAPLAEAKPPKPSPHAVWISGFWKLAGKHWYWIPGWWRVPKGDITGDLTVKVTSAPPPPRIERPGRCPVPGTVWTPGAWYWNGRGFSWIPGACRLPPSRSHRWRRSRWRRKGGILIFVPGGWEITLGR